MLKSEVMASSSWQNNITNSELTTNKNTKPHINHLSMWKITLTFENYVIKHYNEYYAISHKHYFICVNSNSDMHIMLKAFNGKRLLKVFKKNHIVFGLIMLNWSKLLPNCTCISLSTINEHLYTIVSKNKSRGLFMRCKNKWINSVVQRSSYSIDRHAERRHAKTKSNKRDTIYNERKHVIFVNPIKSAQNNKISRYVCSMSALNRLDFRQIEGVTNVPRQNEIMTANNDFLWWDNYTNPVQFINCFF